MKTYHFSWNGRNKFLDADNIDQAKALFMERFGFYPDSDKVSVNIIE